MEGHQADALIGQLDDLRNDVYDAIAKGAELQARATITAMFANYYLKPLTAATMAEIRDQVNEVMSTVVEP